MKPTLAKEYINQNVLGWLMSEKLDGVRAIWDGQKFMSRNEKPIYAPQWFLHELPRWMTLDGELYTERNDFQNIVSIVRKKHPVDNEWETITYKVFDYPSSKEVFTKRLHAMYNCLVQNGRVSIIQHKRVENDNSIQEYMNTLIPLGAEGIMIRNPNAYYENKRTNNLLKYKLSDSSEAIVADIQPGEGKYEGLMGALIVKWNDVIFNIGSGFVDKDRVKPPKIGDMVSFKYWGLSSYGVPRFPIYLAVRNYE